MDGEQFEVWNRSNNNELIETEIMGSRNPPKAAYVSWEQYIGCRVVIESEVIDDNLIERVRKCVELIALGVSFDSSKALTIMKRYTGEIPGVFGFWRTGQIVLVVVLIPKLLTNFVTEPDMISLRDKDWHHGKNYNFNGFPDKIIIFNLDEIAKLHHYDYSTFLYTSFSQSCVLL